MKFDIVVKDHYIEGIICTDSSGKRTSAYPNTVPQNPEIPYSSDYSEYSYNKSSLEIRFSGYISSDPKQAILPDYPRLFTHQLEKKARNIYSAASSLLTHFESQGTSIENKTYSSDDADKFVYAIKDILIAPPNIRWSLTLKDNFVVHVVCYGTNTLSKGEFPKK